MPEPPAGFGGNRGSFGGGGLGRPKGFPSVDVGAGSVILVRYRGRVQPIPWQGRFDLAGGLGYILRQFGDFVTPFALGGGVQVGTNHGRSEVIQTSVANSSAPGRPDRGQTGKVTRRFSRRFEIRPVNVPSLLNVQPTTLPAGADLSGIPMIEIVEL